MKNPATNKTENGFNAFTKFLFDECKAGRKPLVRLRNGRIVDLEWFNADGPEYEYFAFIRKENHTHMCWDNDGTSVTSDELDMMETV